ncbi:MAG TPA: nucleoside transporter C-terminal domain-containing protein, partial [Acidobacteriota bacterium]|nr:nucleoside transporter C-terminal domain-containing protein [Acidobacteriota bacterium]
MQGILGIASFLTVAWVLSEKRRRVDMPLIAKGMLLQFSLVLILLKVPGGREFFALLSRFVRALEEATRAGTSFVFGYLGGGEAPFEVVEASALFVFAFQSLPLVLVISALSAVLFYWKILPRIVEAFSYVLQRSLGIGGAEGLSVAANVFLGMVESPLLIRPYLARLTRSELFTVMGCGMATIAGTVMVLYASLLAPIIPDVLGHILTASVANAVGAIVVTKLMIPETEPPTPGRLLEPEPAESAMDALTQGTLRGVQLILNIVAMLIVLVALIHLANLLLGMIPSPGGEKVTLQGLLGWMMRPVAWLLGVSWAEASPAGSLLGTKLILNELLAYLDLSRLPEGILSQRSALILTYALCGFANPGSVGIMIGGLSTLIPERRSEIVELGMWTIVAGTLATLLTGCMTGIVLA